MPASRLPDAQLQHVYLRLHRRAREMGADPGRNILLRGEATRDGRVRAGTRGELRRSLPILRRMARPEPEPAPAPATGSGPYGGASPTLEAIAACESGGDPTAIGGGGLYRGKYQFTYETWQSVGGTGDPAAAPEAEQDRRAAMLLARDGAGHWPNCG